MNARLAGRRDQVEMFDQAVARAQENGFAVVEICGDLGMGKTRLLAELAYRARQAGLTVTATSALPGEKTVPFGLYADVCPATVDVTGQLSPADRFHLHRAVRDQLGGAMALLLDDVHLADGASQE